MSTSLLFVVYRASQISDVAYTASKELVPISVCEFQLYQTEVENQCCLLFVVSLYQELYLYLLETI
jgi:hypothetical protein